MKFHHGLFSRRAKRCLTSLTDLDFPRLDAQEFGCSRIYLSMKSVDDVALTDGFGFELIRVGCANYKIYKLAYTGV